MIIDILLTVFIVAIISVLIFLPIYIFRIKRLKREYDTLIKAHKAAKSFADTVCEGMEDSNPTKKLTADGIRTAFLYGFMYSHEKKYKNDEL